MRKHDLQDFAVSSSPRSVGHREAAIQSGFRYPKILPATVSWIVKRRVHPSIEVLGTDRSMHLCDGLGAADNVTGLTEMHVGCLRD